jgi:hypothetical protein
MSQCLSMARLAQLNQQIIEAAIEGLEARKKRIDEQIAELRSIAGGGSSRTTIGEAGPRRGRRGRISPEGRAAIAEAQRRRWAAKNAGTTAAAKAAPRKTKRKMSAAGRRAIAEAQKKRWATKKAAAAKAA